MICGAAFVARNALPIKDWFAFEAVLIEYTPRYPQFLMRLHNLDRFSGEMVMNVFQTNPRIFVNGIIISNPHYVPQRQFLGILHA